MNMQSKLLRVLQESQFYRLGGTRQISVNVRVVCANNVPLRKLVDEGKFREDLYYRLNICTIEVPPLRERRADILIMAETFVKKWNKKYGIEKELSPEALNVLYDYYWPGNVRELENVVHRLVISSSDVVISDEEVEDILNENAYGDLINSVKKSFNRNEHLDFHQMMEQQEKQIIEYALKKEGTTRKAAELLGLPQTTFARKKLKYKL
jgi:transcriptional regulator with PAS, ATPase and Fis domain